MAENNAAITTPVVSILTYEALHILTTAANIPYTWSNVRVAEWLGHEDDRVTFDRMLNNNAIPCNIVTRYNQEYNENTHVQVWMPMRGFNEGFMSFLHRRLMNINIDNYDEWIPYMNWGGDDRFLIRMKRYND